MAQRILVVEDEEDIRELIRYNLEREGFTVATAATGEEALVVLRTTPPDCVLLDLMLPGIQGLEVCRQLRSNALTATVPLIMVTAKGEEADIVAGLEMGADDFVTKPFGPRELMARVRSVLRRRTMSVANETILAVGQLAIDSSRHEARLAGDLLPLTLAEFRLLLTLAAHPGRVFTRAQLVRALTGGEHHIVERNVDVHVRSVRKKLGAHGDLVRTIRGVGYKIEAEDN